MFTNSDEYNKEVEYMINKYRVNVILIEDDHFLSNKSRAKLILEGLSKFDIRRLP